MIEDKNRVDHNKYISVLKEVDLRPTKQRVMLISNILLIWQMFGV